MYDADVIASQNLLFTDTVKLSVIRELDFCVMQEAHDIFGDVSGLLEQYEASKARRAENGDDEDEPEVEEAEPEFEDDAAAEQWHLNKVRYYLNIQPYVPVLYMIQGSGYRHVSKVLP